MTMTMPPLGVLCHPRLGLGMFNLRTKFKVVITAHYIANHNVENWVVWGSYAHHTFHNPAPVSGSGFWSVFDCFVGINRNSESLEISGIRKYDRAHTSSY